MATVVFLLRALAKMQCNGIVQTEKLVGMRATVYVSVPANRSGRGKITLNAQGKFMELDAVTDGDEIPTAAEIKVTGCINGNVLVVEKYKKPSITVTTE